jgi:hypothetical protein
MKSFRKKRERRGGLDPHHYSGSLALDLKSRICTDSLVILILRATKIPVFGTADAGICVSI